MESYIIRIYRRGEGVSSDTAGIIEKVGTNREEVFHTADELLEILTGRKGFKSGRDKK